VLGDAAKSSAKFIPLFGVLDRLFSLFAASFNRWKILTEHVKTFTLKRPSDMRWKAKIASEKLSDTGLSTAALHFSLLLREMKDTIETLHKKLLVYINS
jgi:hypothetical protein